MILPIVAYGTPVLRQVAKEIAPDYPNLENLLLICGKRCMQAVALVWQRHR